MSQKLMNPAQLKRFWDKVGKEGPLWAGLIGPCWEWDGAVTTGGYGVCLIGKKRMPAHRASWEIEFGPLPRDRYVKQACKNPLCVNPDHLRLRETRATKKPRRVITMKMKKEMHEEVRLWCKPPREVAKANKVSFAKFCIFLKQVDRCMKSP